MRQLDVLRQPFPMAATTAGRTCPNLLAQLQHSYVNFCVLLDKVPSASFLRTFTQLTHIVFHSLWISHGKHEQYAGSENVNGSICDGWLFTLQTRPFDGVRIQVSLYSQSDTLHEASRPCNVDEPIAYSSPADMPE